MSNVTTLIEGQRQAFTAVCSDPAIDFDREAAFAIQIVMKSTYLQSVTKNNPESLKNAVTNVGAIGVSLNPASKLAYLVPRDGAICLDISYMGLLHIAQVCGAIQWGQAVVVHANDTFELNGIDKEPTHKYAPFSKERGDIIGVYVVVKTDQGDYLTHSMPIDAVYSIRNRSESWKAHIGPKKTNTPWASDPEEMIKKTCVKQASKYWPRRDRLDKAVHHLNTDGGEGLEKIEPNKMGEAELKGFLDRIKQATTHDAAKAIWREAVSICNGLGDVETANLIKAEVIKQREFIDSATTKEKVAA